MRSWLEDAPVGGSIPNGGGSIAGNPIPSWGWLCIAIFAEPGALGFGLSPVPGTNGCDDLRRSVWGRLGIAAIFMGSISFGSSFKSVVLLIDVVGLRTADFALLSLDVIVEYSGTVRSPVPVGAPEAIVARRFIDFLVGLLDPADVGLECPENPSSALDPKEER